MSSTWVGRGAPILLSLYLAWIAFPALHQLHLRLERSGEPCQACPAAEAGWKILSHSPDQPCSDPDHHHHSRPSHDEDHCPACRLGAGVAVALPAPGALLPAVPATRCAVEPQILAPRTLALWAMSPRAPPAPLPA